MLTIAEEVLLLVLDDDTGKLSASLPVHALRNAVVGALLMDLALSIVSTQIAQIDPDRSCTNSSLQNR